MYALITAFLWFEKNNEYKITLAVSCKNLSAVTVTRLLEHWTTEAQKIYMNFPYSNKYIWRQTNYLSVLCLQYVSLQN